jgi:hypothetical protein
MCLDLLNVNALGKVSHQIGLVSIIHFIAVDFLQESTVWITVCLLTAAPGHYNFPWIQGSLSFF